MRQVGKKWCQLEIVVVQRILLSEKRRSKPKQNHEPPTCEVIEQNQGITG
jgi:hypothetical protein